MNIFAGITVFFIGLGIICTGYAIKSKQNLWFVWSFVNFTSASITTVYAF